MTIKPGYGNKRLHLRGASKNLRSEFGVPATKRSVGALRQYWMYPDGNFECLVSRQSGAVLSIFLHPHNPIGAEEFFGLTEDQIRPLFGGPNLEGGGFETEAGYVGRWLSYDEGIGFHFDKSGKVETVSLYARKRRRQTSRSKGSARLSRISVGIAALHVA